MSDNPCNTLGGCAKQWEFDEYKAVAINEIAEREKIITTLQSQLTAAQNKLASVEKVFDKVETLLGTETGYDAYSDACDEVDKALANYKESK